MPDAPRADDTVTLARQSDRLCDRFEYLLLAKQSVSVVAFLRGEGIEPADADPALLRDLDRLAAYYQPSQRPTVAAPAAEDASGPVVAPGLVLAGRYTLVRKIGGGGMGDVWLAEQTEPVRRNVAVKVIKGGIDSHAILARFDAERQALAIMDHPNIARVFDGGVHTVTFPPDEHRAPVSVPFFVMELVDGVPMTQFCDDRKLTARQRLELFVPVCEAIQHAHQKGIIHRDIKPGNVLVALYDGRPVPKVIDFGIAKAVSEPGAGGPSVSYFGAVIGTPEYMSPEQAGGHPVDIDTRSDVYSLGVLLYELLTGHTPVNRKSLGRAALMEVLRIVREVDVPRASAQAATTATEPAIAANRSTEPKKLAQLLRGDLDCVLLKALEKDRDQRYGSPAALAAEVGRYLRNEPVEVGPPSAIYRLRKFVRRNRVPVAAAAAVFLALVAGVVGTTLGLLEARNQAAIAREEAEEKEKANRREVAERQRAEKERDDKEKARAAEEVAKDQAVAATKAEALARKKEEDERRHAEAIAEFVREDFFALTSLEGQSRFAGGHQVPLDPNLTLRQMLDRAVKKLDARTDLQPRTEADLRWMIGVNYRGQGAYENAIVQLERCLALRRKALPPDHRDTLSALNSLALAHGEAGRIDRAQPLLEETVRLMTAKFGLKNRDTLIAMNNLAVAYRRSQQDEQAIPLLERTLEAERALDGRENPITLDNLGLAHRQAGRPDRAIPLHKRAIEALTAQHGRDHPETLVALDNLAGSYLAAGDTDSGLDLTRQVSLRTQDKFGPDHPETLRSGANYAVACWRAGRLDLSVPLFEESLRKHRAVFGRNHSNTLHTAANLAVNYRDAGRFDDALPLFAEIHRASKADPSLGWVGKELLDTYILAGKRREGLAFVTEMLADARARLPKDSQPLAFQLRLCGQGLVDLKAYADAEPALRDSLALRRRYQPDAWSTFDTESLLGEALFGQKKYAEAEPLLVKGYEGLKAREKTIPPQAGGRVSDALDRLVAFYSATGKPSEVVKWRAERAKYPRELAPPPRPAK